MSGPRAADLAGLRFGALVAENRVGTLRGFALWRCRCDCGSIVDVRSDALKRQKSCGCVRPKPALGLTGGKHPRWRGERGLRDGYVWLYRAPGKYAAEHRLVAEAALGRAIAGDEVVHHRNGDKRDNRPENLEVMTRAEHANEHGLGRRIR